MNSNSLRLQRARAGLLVVDIQERLLPAMSEPERVVGNTLRLVRGATILGLPIFATEQYPAGLGRTVEPLATAIPGFAPFAKLAFSACGAAGLLAALEARGVSDVILCGIEAHVCVSQTGLDLLERGRRPFVVADAVSARTPDSHRLGVGRMRDAGAAVVSTEMALFELLEQAGTDEFKRILTLVK